MPILPLLADVAETLETMARWAHEAKASYMLTGILYMRGWIRKRYLNFIAEEFPEYYDEYTALYPKGSASPEYKARVHALFHQFKQQYQINTSYAKFLPKNNKKSYAEETNLSEDMEAPETKRLKKTSTRSTKSQSKSATTEIDSREISLFSNEGNEV